jgi:hypothetical protein
MSLPYIAHHITPLGGRTQRSAPTPDEGFGVIGTTKPAAIRENGRGTSATVWHGWVGGFASRGPAFVARTAEFAG